MKNKLHIVLLLLICSFASAQTNTENYILTTTYKDPRTVNPPRVSSSIEYYDGIGRPIQKIASQQSATGKNIVTHAEYDSFDRLVKEYLPYKSPNTGLDFEPNAKNNTLSYTGYSGQSPYSEKQLENNPLNRVLKQASPGSTWAMGNGKEIKYEYKTNAASEVKKIKAVATWDANSGTYTVAFSDNGNSTYPANELYKTIVKDENWTSGTDNTTEEFKNKAGQVILKRAYGTSTANGTPVNTSHDTYYVYDQFGNLSYVIPPKANGDTSVPTLDNLCYQYRYDHRNRLVEKKIPGKTSWDFIVYDKFDRVVATGPAYLPYTGSSATSEGWNITKYDQFDRPVYHIWYNSQPATSWGRNNLQNSYNTATHINEVRGGSQVGWVDIGYTSQVFPTSGGIHFLDVNYYDNYSISELIGVTLPTSIEGESVLANPKGLLTATFSRVLLDGQFYGNLTYTLYDKKGRNLRTHTKNYLNGYTQVDTKYDFLGKTLLTRTKHKRVPADTEITVVDNFEYSNQERLLTHTHSINGGNHTLLADNTYDELGKVIVKKVGRNVGNPLQTINYSYNIRDWLTGINTDASNNPVLNVSEKDLFSFKINYATVENQTGYTGKALYNGNISETYWLSSADNTIRKYGYFYDALNRLQDAVYMKPNLANGVTGAYNESATYDKNGNIVTMKRKGDFDHPDAAQAIPIDDLTYNYTNSNGTNVLSSVTDAAGANSTFGFKKGNATGLPDFEYDNFGNMTVDRNKGIAAIKYNHLNLPTEITFTSLPQKISYIYDSAGRKMQKKVTSPQNVLTTTDYFDGFQYKNGVLQFFPTAEGYVNFDTDVFKDVFHYKDHLGNTRLSFTESPDPNAAPTIMEQNHYYPFGLKHTNYNVTVMKLRGSTPEVALVPLYKYKYNGKEWQDELSLNWYDYGARNYDAALGRWMNTDPLAEKGREYSPYVYSFNNPVYFIDPDGNWPDFPASFKTAFTNTVNSFKASVNKTIDDVKVTATKAVVKAQKTVANHKGQILGAAKIVQKVGDKITKVGLGAAAVGAIFEGVGAAPGLEIAAAGSAVSGIGAVVEITTNLIVGDNKEGGAKLAEETTGAVVGALVGKVVPGSKETVKQEVKEAVRATQEIIKNTAVDNSKAGVKKVTEQ
ncbi:DUF6443 domain-containing protein [Flavobacterium sp.]|uniref:DUF6443 domain-containing protein n=1 Tax=Flavobacterium sp. TaxID=239 RepID=UPI0039E38BD5